jgi:phenylpyruvate tautomerase PptA (4-oxalocrotonate tautomerase family)
MPIVTVQFMEGVLSAEQKKTMITNIVDAVTGVYGRPMRLFMNVVLEEIKTGDWFASGNVVTSERIRLISPNVRRAAAGKTPAASSSKPAKAVRATRSRRT